MPYQSSYPPIDIPEVDIWTLLFERKSKPFLDSKEIFTDGETGRTIDYGQLRAAALEFGKGLKGLWNWKRGDVMAFYTPNSVDTPVVTAGLLWAGGVASPANPLYTLDELAFQLGDSGAKALVTQKAYLPTAVEAARRVGLPEDRIILVGEVMGVDDYYDDEAKRKEQRSRSGARFKHFTSISSTFYCSRYAQTLVDPRTDLAFLVYSSGTTGVPKGVCLSHHNVVVNILQTAWTDGLHLLPHGGLDGKGDRLLGTIPFFHIYGLTCCVFTSMYLGWELVVMSRFDLERACSLIEKHRITYAYVPPPIVLAFAKSPVVDRYDLGSLRMLHSGAAPLTRELTEELWARLGIPVKQGFGLSETSPVVTIQMPDEWAEFMGSVGKLLPNMEARLVGADGLDVAEGEEGELWVRGPNVFLGYLNQPDRTREAMSPCGAYFRTGDVFRRDRRGNYYCVDRLKELIKYKGFQVAPAELEGLLLGHADVLDAGVIGVFDPEQATELPRAYVVLKQEQQQRQDGVTGEKGAGGGGGGGDEQAEKKAREITEWMAARVAPHKKLRGGVAIVKEIPKSPSGKILRRVLRDQAKREVRNGGAKL